MNWKVAGMAGTALLTVGLSGFGAVAAANKFSGNVSLAVGQSFENEKNFDFGAFELLDESFASVTGSSQINVAFTNNLNLQVDLMGVGSFVDTNSGLSLNRDSSFQATGHLYWRDNNFAAGIYGGLGVASTKMLPSADFYFAGVEGQYYLDNFTIGLSAGYLDSSSELDVLALIPLSSDDLALTEAWTVKGEVRWYASKKLSITADAGYISGEYAAGTADAEVLHWGLKAEYVPEEKEPLSLWIAYEGRSSDAKFGDDALSPGTKASKDSHTVKIGVTFRFGGEGSVQEHDRSGPAFNQFDYGEVVVSG